MRGEKIAEDYLRRQGYRIITRNYRHGRAEIDLVCRKSNWLIFVEVKTRSGLSYGFPEQHVSPSQVKRITAAAEAFSQELEVCMLHRFDIIGIIWHGSSYSLRHFEDAFY